MKLCGGFIRCMPGRMLVDPGNVGLALDGQIILRWRFFSQFLWPVSVTLASTEIFRAARRKWHSALMLGSGHLAASRRMEAAPRRIAGAPGPHGSQTRRRAPHYEDQTCFRILPVWPTPAGSKPDRADPLSVFSILLRLERELPVDLILLW